MTSVLLLCEQEWTVNLDYPPKPDKQLLGYQVICRRRPDEEYLDSARLKMAKKKKLPAAAREDTPSGSSKKIDKLDQLLHEDGLEVEGRLAVATDILCELVTRTQEIPYLLEVVQDQLTGNVTRIAQDLE